MQEAHDMRPAVGPFARPQSAVPGDRVADRRRRPDQLARMAVQRIRRVVRYTVVRRILLDTRDHAILPPLLYPHAAAAAGQLYAAKLRPTTNALLTVA